MINQHVSNKVHNLFKVMASITMKITMKNMIILIVTTMLFLTITLKMVILIIKNVKSIWYMILTFKMIFLLTNMIMMKIIILMKLVLTEIKTAIVKMTSR